MSELVGETGMALEVLPLRDHLSVLRQTDLENWRSLLVALELRLQQRFDAQEASVTTAMIAAEKAVNAALVAAEKAVDKAEQAQALRNIVANEFRSTIADNTATMWSSKEGLAALSSLEAKFDASNQATHRENAALIDGVNARLKNLEAARDMSLGRDRGVYLVWTVAGSAVLLVLAILGFALARGGP